METKPESIKKFITDNKEHAELIKKAIKIYNEDCHYSSLKLCSICDKELTLEDISTISSNEFTRTCKDHRKYAHSFMIDGIRKELGFSERQILDLYP